MDNEKIIPTFHSVEQKRQMIKELLEEAKRITEVGYGFIRFSCFDVEMREMRRKRRIYISSKRGLD